ncbi:MAG TPA: YceI family protein [Candidatus Limnocylindrales bacterium]
MTDSRSPTVSQAHGNRNLLIVAVAVLALAVVAAGGYALWYILIGPASPAAVNGEAPVIPASASVPAPASFDGSWQVDTSLGSMTDFSASWAGYRVQEQLVGVGGHTAVGRTPKVSGSMTLTGSIIDNVQITADLTALASDDSNRDGQLQRQAIETGTYPTAMFKTIQPIDLGTLPADGKIVSVTATGALSLHGTIKTVQITLQAQRRGGIIAVAGSVPIVFADFGIKGPNSFSVVSVDDHGIMELHLLFTHA